MAFVAPRTWVVGELVTAAMLNQDIRDNIGYVRTEACSLWIPVTNCRTGAVNDEPTTQFGGHSTAELTDANDWGIMEFRCPDGFVSITTAVAVIIPRVTDAAAEYTITTYYGASGEDYQNHTESDAASTYNVTTDQIFEIDASGVLTGIAAGDYIGIMVRLRNAGHNCNVLGFHMVYASV